MLIPDNKITEYSKKYGLITPFNQGLSEAGQISSGLSSYGYDFTLADTEVYEFRPKFAFWHRFRNLLSDLFGLPYSFVIDMKAIKENPEKYLKKCKIHKDSTGTFVIIRPGSFILGTTVEYVKMPRNVTGLIKGKSTPARAGISVPPNVLEAEWEGQITVEIINSTLYANKVYLNEGIFQVLFSESAEEPDVGYGDRKGKYQGQTGVTFARIKTKQ